MGGRWKGKAMIAVYDGEQSWGALGTQQNCGETNGSGDKENCPMRKKCPKGNFSHKAEIRQERMF